MSIVRQDRTIFGLFFRGYVKNTHNNSQTINEFKNKI